MVGRGKGCCQTSHKAQDSPRNERLSGSICAQWQVEKACLRLRAYLVLETWQVTRALLEHVQGPDASCQCRQLRGSLARFF